MFRERIFSVFQDYVFARKVMFKIPKGYDIVAKTIRLPEPLADQLYELAAKNNISFNLLINECINFSLNEMGSHGEKNSFDSFMKLKMHSFCTRNLNLYF
ncbi:MAG: hypothetical protein NC485_11385 [Ruminococcus flavefaciens]|nr:hypothetical protein [Ruminococcus flavefaciens]MCM1060507.1 hypothetical protein [Eubacterium sp.]